MKLSRQTKQKELLEGEIKKINHFFTAHELFSKIYLKDKKIGIATIYRYLKYLVNQAKIHSYQCNRRTIYSLHQKNHCHFTCERCGKTEHINIKSIDFMKNNLNGSICHFQINVNGVCKRCLNKGE